RCLTRPPGAVTQARYVLGETGETGDVKVLERLAAQHLQTDGYSLHVLHALLRGHDDFLELPGFAWLGSDGEAAAGKHGGCQRHAGPLRAHSCQFSLSATGHACLPWEICFSQSRALHKVARVSSF